jgi:glycosyltransferase involved in cell wall biosynthesis
MEDHTFVIPAYKDSTFIEECIVSLKNQPAKVIFA